jgi:transposase InsO family protein
MLKSLFQLFCKSFSTNFQLKLEVIYLTKQLEIYQRNDPKLKISGTDRMFFSFMRSILSNWREKLFIVKPNTLIKWHRLGFRHFWKQKSGKEGGRPSMNLEVIILIKKMVAENPLWGAPRIHSELLMLGYKICESTVQRYMPKKGKKNNGQNWKTFLKNHFMDIISIDFLTVPTINFKQMYVLVIIEHYRRKLIHFNVTSNPTSEWTIQQIRNLLFDYKAPKYLIRDRDKKYGNLFSEGINNFGIKQIMTAYRCPWQNGYVERVIGTIKRECLDHVIILNENHLKSILDNYVSYYNKYRPHLGINQDSPEGRAVQSEGTIYKVPAVNGLHHVYFRKAA